jgi:DNA-nicking Smr family endonuclease
VTGKPSNPWEEPVQMPIDGVLDLHTFRPSDLPDLLKDYLQACEARGILNVRVIHGKGRGILRRRVRQLLADLPNVRRYQDAGPEAGGWGATLVTLHPLP